jgi:hypothetical protein
MLLMADSTSFLANSRFQIAMPSAISSLSSAVEEGPLDGDFEPGEYDVVCGRGKGAYNRSGNMHMRVIVQGHIEEYLSARTKLDKSLALNNIIEEIRAQNDGNAKFVKQQKGGAWFEIGDELAREKVGHAIREAIHAKEEAPRKIECQPVFKAKQTDLLSAQRALFEIMKESNRNEQNAFGKTTTVEFSEYPL